MVSYTLPQNWLREQLQQHGTSQKTLAEALGIDAPTASRLIAGKRRLQFEELPKLIALLGGDKSAWRLDPSRPLGPQAKGRLEAALKAARMEPAIFADLTGQSHEAVLSALEEGGALKDEAISAAAAHLLGISQSYLQMSGGPANSPDALYRLAKRWGTAGPDEQQADPTGPIPTQSAAAATMVPIYAAPRPLGGGAYDWTETVAETRPTPLLTSITGAWGMFVGEGGAPPRFAQGDVLFVHPHRPVRHGDFAISRMAGRLTMGTVSTDDGTARLLDSKGEPIPELKGARLEKVIAATFD